MCGGGERGRFRTKRKKVLKWKTIAEKVRI